MGKRNRKDDEIVVKESTEKNNESRHAKKSVLFDDKAVDPNLASLFASSFGPVKAPPKSRYEEPPPPSKRFNVDLDSESEDGAELGSDVDDEELSSVDEDLEDADIIESTEDEDESGEEPELDKLIETSIKKERKRRRHTEEDDLEGKYMQRLAKEEEKEDQERRLKRQRLMAEEDPDVSEDGLDEERGTHTSEEETEEERANGDITSGRRTMPSDVPLHESLAPSKEVAELEKSSRTVFLANVSTLAITSKSAKKTLLAHMASFLDSLPDPPDGKPRHKVESLRFRSTAYASMSLPKKAAFAKKELMDATTKSTNAYVVYSTAFAAREAVKKLNGSMVLDRHLRVDGVAHPAKIDHRRCVFVGNLGFVDDESLLDQGGENERKRSKIPSDIEEGLWRQFSKAGTVESVRVVRDEKTRVGKGFAYVQFQDANVVEAALLFNEKKYPPMLPRVLRVVRAKAVRKTSQVSQQFRTSSRPPLTGSNNPNREPIYNPKMTSQQSSLQGRARKLLGRAGAAKLRKLEGNEKDGRSKLGIEGFKTPENIVFEGYRASAKSGKPKDLKMGGGGGGKKKGKPRTRGSKRASDWRKGAGKK